MCRSGGGGTVVPSIVPTRVRTRDYSLASCAHGLLLDCRLRLYNCTSCFFTCNFLSLLRPTRIPCREFKETRICRRKECTAIPHRSSGRLMRMTFTKKWSNYAHLVYFCPLQLYIVPGGHVPSLVGRQRGSLRHVDLQRGCYLTIIATHQEVGTTGYG